MASDASFTPARNECSITGTVEDSNGNAVAGATVKLSNGMSATTDTDGRFELTGVPPGSHSLDVVKEGFQTATRTVTVTAGDESDLQIVSLTAGPAVGGGRGIMLAAIAVVAAASLLGIGFLMYRRRNE